MPWVFLDLYTVAIAIAVTIAVAVAVTVTIAIAIAFFAVRIVKKDRHIRQFLFFVKVLGDSKHTLIKEIGPYYVNHAVRIFCNQQSIRNKTYRSGIDNDIIVFLLNLFKQPADFIVQQ